jgi:iron complex transport system substrate-binding protein
MQRVVAVVLVGLLAVTAAGGVTAQTAEPVECEFPVTVTDATGESVTVAEEPGEVVALSPSVAQTLWAVDARQKVTGMPVNSFTAYLNGSESRTNVLGSGLSVVNEAVVGLEPDLVLAANVVENQTVRTLRDAGLTVYKFREAGSLADVYAKTELTGRLVGRFPAAARTSAEMQGTVEAVRAAVADEERPDVVYVTGGSGFVAGPRTFIGGILEAAGGHNIVSDLNNTRPYFQLSPEVVAQRGVDYIVIPEGRTLPDTYNGTTAVQEDQVVRVDANFVSQPGPRNVEPLTRLAERFHPEAYAAADVENTAVPEPRQCAAVSTPTATDAGSAGGATGDATATDVGEVTATLQSADGEADATTTGAGGAGFGVVAATLALVVAAVVALRVR